MATIRTLYVALKAQTDDYNKKIKAAQQEAKEFERVLRPMSQTLSDIGTSMAVAGGIVAVGMLGMAKKAADYGDEMLEASQKTGIATKELAALRLVAEQSGSSFEGITTGAVKLSKTLFDAATTGGEAAKTFQALGISVKDASGHVRQAADVLPEIAERFASMKDGTEKTAMAMRLFGKAGADMIPILNQGAEGFRRAAEMVDKYNLETKDGGHLGDQFNDSLKITGIAMQGLSNQIGAALLPGMIRLVEIGNNVIAMVSRWAKEHPGLTRGIALTAGALVGGGGLLLAMSKFLQLAPGMLSQVKLIGSAFMGLSVPMRIVVVALTLLTAAFLAFPKIRGPVIEVLAGINQILFANIDLFGRLAGILVRLAKGEFTAAWETLKSLPDQVMESWESRGNMVRNFAKGIGESIQGMNDALKMKPEDIKMPDFSLDLDGLGKDAKEATNQVEQLWKSLKRESGEAEALEAVLMRASAAHISFSDVSDKLGSTINDVAQELMYTADGVLPEYIARSYALMKQQEAYNETVKEWQQVAQHTIDLYQAEAKELQKITEIEIVRSTDDATAARLRAAEAVGKHRLELKNATRELEIQQRQFADTAAAMAQLSREGYSATQIEQMLGMRLEDVTKRAKDMGVGLDSVTKKTIENAARADTLKRSWGEAFASMSDQLVDMITDFDFSFTRLKDIGLDTAKSLATSFLDGFFKPFKDGLQNLGEAAGTWLSNLAFGTSAAGGQGGQGGGLVGLLGGGGIFSGLFGGGNQGPMSEQMPGSGIGAGGVLINGGGFGGGATQLTGMASKLNPIGMGLGIANDAVDLYNKTFGRIGAGRKSADEIVKSQNSFVNQTLAGILSDSSLSATNKLKMVGNEFDIFRENLDRFSAGGDKNATTANQAFATVAPLVSQIKADLMKAGAKEGGEDAAAPAGTTIQVEKIEQNFYLEGVTDVPTFIDWLKRNVGGLTEEIVRQVELKEGAVVSR